MFPSPRGTYWRSSNFDRRVLAPAYRAAGWRDADGDGTWTWHSLRHVFCTAALFSWRLEPTDVSCMAGHANVRVTLDMTGISDLGPVHAHLATLVGGGAALAFGVALMASGLSSSSVGTYAGQIVMAGFMNWRIPLLARRALTMAPSLIILALAVNPSQALVYSQIILSFGIPFALIPLLLITRDPSTMTDMANRRLTSTLMLLVTVLITGLNLCLLYDAATSLL